MIPIPRHAKKMSGLQTLTTPDIAAHRRLSKSQQTSLPCAAQYRKTSPWTSRPHTDSQQSYHPVQSDQEHNIDGCEYSPPFSRSISVTRSPSDTSYAKKAGEHITGSAGGAQQVCRLPCPRRKRLLSLERFLRCVSSRADAQHRTHVLQEPERLKLALNPPSLG